MRSHREDTTVFFPFFNEKRTQLTSYFPFLVFSCRREASSSCFPFPGLMEMSLFFLLETMRGPPALRMPYSFFLEMDSPRLSFPSFLEVVLSEAAGELLFLRLWSLMVTRSCAPFFFHRPVSLPLSLADNGRSFSASDVRAPLLSSARTST